MLCKMPAACGYSWNWLLETKGSQVLQWFFHDPGCVWNVLMWRSINWLDLELQMNFVVGRTESFMLLSVQDHPLSPWPLHCPRPTGLYSCSGDVIEPFSFKWTSHSTTHTLRLPPCVHHYLGHDGDKQGNPWHKKILFWFSGVEALSSWTFIPQGHVTCTGVLRA